MKECYIAIGPLVWGRGKTQDDAVKNCRKEYPCREPFQCIVMYVMGDDEAYVDDFGHLCLAEGAVYNEVARVGRWPKGDGKREG